MKIVLIGYMGSGKSSVGKYLAKALKYNFIDLDTYIESSQEKSISEIFNQNGEIYFRKIEALALQKICAEHENFVLATGGGTPCYGNSMQYLLDRDDVLTFYLKASLDTLTKRLYSQKNERPVITHLESKELLYDFIRKHLFERSYYYNQAVEKITTDEKEINSIVSEIVLTLF